MFCMFCLLCVLCVPYGVTLSDTVSESDFSAGSGRRSASNGSGKREGFCTDMDGIGGSGCAEAFCCVVVF
ncbi:MAG: hypothetical protein ACLUAI_12810, partial [Lachnospira sp.]